MGYGLGVHGLGLRGYGFKGNGLHRYYTIVVVIVLRDGAWRRESLHWWCRYKGNWEGECISGLKGAQQY